MSSEISRLVALLDQFIARELNPLDFRDELERMLRTNLQDKVSADEWHRITGFIQRLDSFSPALPTATKFLSRLSRVWKEANGDWAYSEEGLRREVENFRAELTHQLPWWKKYFKLFQLPK